MYMIVDPKLVFAGLGKLWAQDTMQFDITDFYRYSIEAEASQLMTVSLSGRILQCITTEQ